MCDWAEWAGSFLRYFNNLAFFSLQTVFSVGAAARTSQHPAPACPWCAPDELKRALRARADCKIHWGKDFLIGLESEPRPTARSSLANQRPRDLSRPIRSQDGC